MFEDLKTEKAEIKEKDLDDKDLKEDENEYKFPI